MPVKFNATKKDAKTISMIVDRAFNEFENIHGTKTDLSMDIMATHCNGKVKNQPPDLTAGEFNRGE